jgi:hypothetical protein
VARLVPIGSRVEAGAAIAQGDPRCPLSRPANSPARWRTSLSGFRSTFQVTALGHLRLDKKIREVWRRQSGRGKGGWFPCARKTGAKAKLRRRVGEWRCVEPSKVAGGWLMSTDADSGLPKIIDAAMREGAARLAEERAAQAQLDLLEPLTAEEMLEAREGLGPKASELTVVRTAREARRRGRPPGATNRRTDDLVAYLSQHGPDPAVAAMRIIATTEELMVARSKAVDPVKRRMTFAEAQAHRERMIELMMPYWHGKKPVQVDVSFAGVGDLVIEGWSGGTVDAAEVVDADFMALDDDGSAVIGPNDDEGGAR